ncbi:MAG: molybdopterin molybdotransferase MoeA [Clostridium sp.]
MKLLQVDTLTEAEAKLMNCFKQRPVEVETISLENALGKILATDVTSKGDIPSFYRSSVDGYAVRSSDTAGASESVPVLLTIIEEVAIGSEAQKTVESGQCTYVPTGGMVPKGADAMVMVEYCEPFGSHQTAVYESVPFGKAVVVPGEDIKAGQCLLSGGTKLEPAHIGALAASGVTRVPVFRCWRTAVISTGDELIPSDCRPVRGQVRDINTWALTAAAEAAGFQVVMRRVLPDREEIIRRTVEEAMSSCDLVLISGGSSQGKKDLTCDILNAVSDGGVFTHGLALKPGKPTILGFDTQTGTLLAGLPGHPVAALIVFNLLIARLWKKMTGQKETFGTEAFMDCGLASDPGKTTCILVHLAPSEGVLTAYPILGKSGLITTMTAADGYILVDMNQEGVKKGERVTVYPLES